MTAKVISVKYIFLVFRIFSHSFTLVPQAMNNSYLQLPWTVVLIVFSLRQLYMGKHWYTTFPLRIYRPLCTPEEVSMLFLWSIVAPSAWCTWDNKSTLKRKQLISQTNLERFGIESLPLQYQGKINCAIKNFRNTASGLQKTHERT